MRESPRPPQILLLIDLGCGGDRLWVDDCLTRICKIEVINHGGDIDNAISNYRPNILCFDFDLPDQIGLSALQRTKLRHPSLPIILFTKDHSAELAIWALRSRVWDYFVKPVAADVLAGSIKALLEQRLADDRARRRNLMPPPLIPSRPRHHRTGAGRIPTSLAVSYVREQLHKKITLSCVTKLCGMGKSHFSRTFKSDHGITFQEFLIQQRITKAVELLKDSDLQVTQVAFAVGFPDLSNFIRMFRRHIGMSPSCYRKALTRQHSKNNNKRIPAAKFPKVNPNPVLSCGPDGKLRFVNPATSQLLQEFDLERLEDVLPGNHSGLVKACLGTRTSLTDERKTAGRTIVWSYCPVDDSDVIYIYGHDVSDYLSGSDGTEGLPKENPYPVLSRGPDGKLRFVNPVTSQLFQEFDLERLEDVLPGNHSGLVKPKPCEKARITRKTH